MAARPGVAFEARWRILDTHAGQILNAQTMPQPGAVAQLGERHVRNVEVGGSIPLGSTRYFFIRQHHQKYNR